MKIRAAVLSVLAVTAAAGSASATGPDITATFNGIIPNVPITWSVNGGGINNPGAAGCFSWTKTGGTYTGVSGNFTGFCLELTETIQEPNSYTYKVVSLDLAPDGGDPGGFTFPLGPVGADQLSEMWAAWYPSLDSSDPVECGAFQLAIWEIVYDGNLIINGLGDSLQFGAAPAVLALAQTYLTVIDGVGPRASLDALTHPTAQDQVVPVPGTLALLGLGGLIAGRRRR